MENHFYKYWSLKSSNGRTMWEFTPPAHLAQERWDVPENKEVLDFLSQLSEAFIFDKKSNPNSGDRVYRNGVEADKSTEGTGALEKAISYYESLQSRDGCWVGDYAGPLFLLPGLVITAYITGSPFAAPQAAMMTRYMLNHQNPDGGWGLHLEGASTMFGTVLQYISLRLLGASSDDKNIIKAKHWIHAHGGATGIPSWGKFYLAVLGVYDWQGCNSLLPELWLLPRWLPIHPSRYWCHSRMVYLPMAYLYGKRFSHPLHELTAAIREEIHIKPYDTIDWEAARNHCASTDLYYPQKPALKWMNRLVNLYEKSPVKKWRKKALDFCLDYINAEDAQTNYINIGPVNQVLNSLAVYQAYGPESAPYQQHYERWDDYLWLAEDGMKMQGYNGSQLWDTAFATQAILESGIGGKFPTLLERADKYIRNSQIVTEVADRERYFRHIQIGGWPFSTREHGWPITDCTAEGLKATLALQSLW